MNLADQIEALLFVSDGPTSLETLAATLDINLGVIEQAIEKLIERLESAGALRVVQLAGGYQLATKPEHAEIIARHLKPQKQKLSKSMMEVLAIVAYKKLATASEIEQIRGVQSDYGIRMLLERNLIFEAGRRSTPGRPIEYAPTQQFLHQFNLSDLDQLPKIEIEALPNRSHSELGSNQINEEDAMDLEEVESR